MKKRKVLSVWKSILLTFAGVLGVAGVTVLGVYLTKGFDEEKVLPESIAFEQTLDSGLGYFNSEANRFEVSSDFQITITTPTEGVTENEIELSLDHGTLDDGYIKNDVIRVPQFVEIGTPFTVQLVTKDNISLLQDWVFGGISTITAESTADVNIDHKSATIAVDVPVKNISVKIAGSEQNLNEPQNVVVGSYFSLETIYSPNESERLYKEDSAQKEVFYDILTTAIDYDFETDKFFAKNRTVGENNSIVVYTFKNAYYQHEILTRFAAETDPADRSANILAYFKSLEREQGIVAYVSREIDINVLAVDVATVQMQIPTMSSYVDKYFTLTASSAKGNANLDLDIRDSKGDKLDYLFANVGIKIPKDNNLKIVGGKLVKVEDGKVSAPQDYDDSIDFAEVADGIEYYLLPNIAPAEYGNYYWDFASTVEADYELLVNFFYEKDGEWKAFFGGEGQAEKTLTFSTRHHSNEEDPSWLTNEAIEMTISFDEDGTANQAVEDLSKLIRGIEADNVYKEVRYFLFIDEEDPAGFANITVTDVFNCKPGVEYTTNYLGEALEIPYTIERSSYTLYELNSAQLRALKSFSGKVKVVLATIKTDADLNPEMDGNKYKLVRVSRPKDVTVESLLSIANMTPTFTFDDVAEQIEEDYYLPAINRNESGAQKDVVDFKLILSNSEDPESDSTKIINAYNSGKLKVVCKMGETVVNYITLRGLVQETYDANSITFTGSFAIEEGYFTPGTNAVDMKGTRLSLELQYNDGKEVFSKQILKEGEPDINSFYVYYQQPVRMVGNFESQNDLDVNADGKIDPIEVVSSSDGLEISWGGKNLTSDKLEDTLENLNDLLAFKLYDQFEKEIPANTGEYSVRFVEDIPTGETGLLGFDSSYTKIQAFVSTQGVSDSTTMTVYVVDKEGRICYSYDEDGNLIYENDQPKPLCSISLDFEIVSEGISSIKKLPDEFEGELITDPTAANYSYVDNGNIGSVTIRKTVKAEEKIELDKWVKIYIEKTSEGVTEEVEDTGRVFMLDDDYVATFSSNTKVDIMKMISFTDANGNTSKYDGTDNLDNWKGKAIKEINVKNPFKNDTRMQFLIRDANGSLYEVSLIFEFRADLSITPTFATYYEENKEYLVKQGTAEGVFADEKYSLLKYLSLTSSSEEYSWLTGLANFLTEGNNLFYCEQEDICYLEVVTDEGGVAVDINLVIAPLYQFKTITVTIYYGVNCSFACSTTFSLYVNPNIVAEQQSEEVELKGFNSPNVRQFYKFYKATDYIKGVKTELDTEMVFDNISQEQYLSIDEYNNMAVVSEKTINIDLGETINQEFSVKAQDATETLVLVDAVKVLVDGTIIPCSFDDEGVSKHLILGLEMCYGSDALETATSLIRRVLESGEEDVQVVLYNGEPMLLLYENSKYSTPDGMSNVSIDVSSINGEMRDFGGDLATNSLSTYLDATDNSFRISVDINGLKLNILLRAVISKVGSKFVHYEDDTGDINFADKDLAILLGSIETLEENDIYQKMYAGQEYEIVFEESIADYLPGFYYNDSLLGVSENYSRISLSVAKVEGGESNLASITSENKLKLNHLSSTYEDIYVVLKIELTGYTMEPFSWYYRIMVLPSFEMADVTYPYADEVEHLDETTEGFNSQTLSYEIDLAETLSYENSKYADATRFGNALFIDAGGNFSQTKTVETSYNVLKVYVNGEVADNWSAYFTYEFDEDMFKIRLLQRDVQLNVVIQRHLTSEGFEMVGSSQNYTFSFNQSSNYKFRVTQNIGGTDKQFEGESGDVFNTTINAGDGDVTFKTELYISSNNTQTKVNDYQFAIKGSSEELLKALKFKYYMPKGTIVYLSDYTTQDKILENDLLISENWLSEVTTEYDAENLQIVVDSVTYYVKKASVQMCFAYVDSNNLLTIVPQENIEEDKTISLLCYTTEKVVFEIDVKVESYLEAVVNSDTTLLGGREYSFDGEIFKKIGFKEGKQPEGVTITNFEVELKNGDIEYREGFTLADLIMIEDGLAGKISFAHLAQDVTFEFGGKFSLSNSATYTFGFALTVGKSFDLEKEYRYSQSKTEIETSGLSVDVDNTLISALIGSGSTTGFAYAENFVAKQVGEEGWAEESLSIGYTFNSKDLFEFEAIYSYYVQPNVTLDPNYPAPDGVNEVSEKTEYVSTSANADPTSVAKYISDSIENFFGSKAKFAIENRVVAEKQGGYTGELVWDINVSSISSNAVVFVMNGASIAKTITNSTSDKRISTSTDVDLKFGLSDTSSNGTVVFDVTVNGVAKLYSVTIVAGSIIKVDTYPTNYTNDGEVLFAEDLSAYEEKEIFKQDRILSYTLNSSATNGKYYVVVKKGNVTEIIDIDNTTINSQVNKDLGKSFVGYEYAGTYSDKDLETRAEGIYAQAPVITSRIVASYYNGDKLKLADSDILLNGTSVSDVEISTTNLNQVQEWSIRISGISTTFVYKTYLTLELSVKGDAQVKDGKVSTYTTVELKAGETVNLLSLTSFKITNQRTNSLYTSFGDCEGTVDLAVYGLDISWTEDDGSVADIYDRYFKAFEENGIKYLTGISPYYGVSTDNKYLRLSQPIGSSQITDYTIQALGAGNDGNHVLMKLTYIVDIGSGTVSVSYDLLFKVVPNTNIEFKTLPNEIATIEASKEIINFSSIASNYVDPYKLSGITSDATLWLYGAANENNDAILAYMYGSSTNLASQFTYTYTIGTPQNYNDFDQLDDSTDGTLIDSGWVDGSGKYTASSGQSSVSLRVPELELGAKHFVLTAINKYGYQMKFYFDLTAPINPQVSLSTSTFVEGSTLAFGIKYKEVSIEKTSEGLVQHDSFKYESKVVTGVTATNYYTDQIKITGAIGGTESYVNQIILTLEDNGMTYEKTITPVAVSEIAVVRVSGEWTDIEGTDTRTFEVEYLAMTSKTINVSVSLNSGNDPALMGYSLNVQYITKDGSTALTEEIALPTNSHKASPNDITPSFTYTSGTGPSAIIATPQITGLFTGIDAFAYSQTDAIDSNSILKSNIGDIYVSKIELYHKNEKIGSVSGTANNLVTASGWTFVNSDGTKTTGVACTEEIVMTIPHVNGILYGASNNLDNVRLDIYLTKGSYTSVISKDIILQKIAPTLFTETEVLDGSSPVKASGTGIPTIYNDTLEIELAPNTSVTFAIHNSAITSFGTDVNGRTTINGSTIANMITLSNDRDYTITEYVGITNNIVGLTENLTAGDSFYIGSPATLPAGATFKYNNSTISATGTIATYSSITLNLDSINELSANRQKNVRLYFLYSENGQTYQHQEMFTITQAYKTITSSSDITATDYIKMTKGGSHYYVIPYENWATKVEVDGTVLGSGDAYKFYFKIENNATGGSGFVDENGTITTTENFKVGSYYVAVEVYVKVSGANAQFEENNTTLHLGTINISLGTEPTGSNTSSAGVYEYGSNNLVVLADGWTSSKTLTSVSLASATDKGAFAVGVNETLDFKQMFDDSYASTTNENYHLVKIGQEYITTNNLNSYSFGTAGSYDLIFVKTYRNSGIYTTQVLSATVMVYSTTSTEQRFDVAKNNVETTLTGSWYERNQSGVTESTGFKETVDGIYEKSYLETSDGVKLIDIDWFVYSAEAEKEFALYSLTTYQFADLFNASTAEVYEVKYTDASKTTVSTISKESSVMFENGVDYQEERTYYVKIGSTATLYTIVFKIISDDVTEYKQIISSTASEKSLVESYINYIHSGATIQMLNDSTNELTSNADITRAANYYTQKYLVTTADEHLVVYEFEFYSYSEAKEITFSTEANRAFSLAELDSTVRSEVGAGATDIVSYYDSTSLEQAYTINLEESREVTYYVKAGESFYLITFQLNI
ncbi:MAG: hypothetical protein E7375_00295 [Clostridiales bacterium]|nr:hypothetical protein [Clostridiales bacterium]